MDAVPTADTDACTSIAVERVTEPFSGMPLIRVTGYWQAVSACPMPDAIEIRYDDQLATRCELTRAEAADIPPGHTRLNFGTQLPVETGIRDVAVVLVSASGSRVVYRSSAEAIGREQPDPPRGIAGRLVESVVSGQAFSIWRWKARLVRYAGKALELRQKVRYRLLTRKFRPRARHDAYVENTALTPQLRRAMADDVARFEYRPTFSILMPVYSGRDKPVGSKWLKTAVESVRAQVYPHWELCIADDHSTDPEVVRYLDRRPDDPRIRVARRETNGHICAATNTAADMATGEFVCLLDHDDELAPHALYAIAERLQRHRDADLIYSDEDKIDAGGRRYDPQFKPDWSPELLLSYNYVNHFTVIRRNMFERAGRFRTGFEGSQDHDLLLRVAELTDRVQHVPHILYHWRALPASTAAAATVKGYVHTSGRRAVEEALERRGVSASFYVPPFAGRLGLPVLALDGPDEGPGVAVFVYGDPAAGARTARAIHEGTAYRNYSIHLVPPGDSPATRLNQMAAGRTEEFILFVEAGAEPKDPRWLSRLLANLRLPGVGAVGPRAIGPDGGILDAGILSNMRDGTAPAPAFTGLSPDQISYYFYAEVTRTVSALSGRCLLTRRETFARVGGFDAGRYPAGRWDIDYGYRLRRHGLRCVYVGGAEVRMPSGESRTLPAELLALKHAYGRASDPYHNPNCSEWAAWEQRTFHPQGLPTAARTAPVRALVVAHNLNNPEGAPRYLSEIVTGLHDRGVIDPVVYSPLGGPGRAVYDDAGIPVDVREGATSRRFVDGQWSPREYEEAQHAARRVLRDHRPDVVIANTLMALPLVEAAARVGLPAVWIIHESYSRDHLERLFPAFARKRIGQTFAVAAHVVPASHDTAALFAHLDTRGNVQVIHNGLDPDPFNAYLRRVSRDAAAARVPGSPGVKRVVAVGTVCERKGQHTLVEAAATLARERADFACYLVGMREGIPYADYVRHLVARHRLEGVVHLVPETDDVWSFYRAADAFVCTSHMETFSRAILEAESFGLPVVTTPCPGAAEQVYWGANALRFGFGDSRRLADHLRTLLSDDALREEMGRQSRAAFENHLSRDEMLDRYAAVVRAAARHRADTAGLPVDTPGGNAHRAA